MAGKRLDADGQLALEMAVCAEYRIPHSHFLGRRLRWTADDRDKAIWFLRRQREACGECGTRAEEWDESRGGHRHAYKYEFEHCRGCEVRKAGEAALESNRKHYPKGTYVALRPRKR